MYTCIHAHMYSYIHPCIYMHGLIIAMHTLHVKKPHSDCSESLIKNHPNRLLCCLLLLHHVFAHFVFYYLFIIPPHLLPVLVYLQQRCSQWSRWAPRLANLCWGGRKVATPCSSFVCHALACQHLHATRLWRGSACGTLPYVITT